MSRKQRRFSKDGKDNKPEVPEMKDKVEDTKLEGKDTQERAHNDPAWYSRDQRLVIDTASVPYSEPFGAPVKFVSNPQVVEWLDTTWKKDLAWNAGAVPGIMVLSARPSFNESHDRNSPLNVAATALYSQVRYVNNGRKNYDPSDLFMYVTVVTDLYAFLNWCRRVYGAAFLYSQANKYLGKAMLMAMGVNPENIISNLANFRYWVNAFTNKIASYAVPADLTLAFKRAFQFSSIYIEHEGDSVKDQMYMYNPDAFYKFRLDQDNVGMLELIPFPRTQTVDGMTFADISAYGEGLLENIWGDEDFGLMSGDLLRAFNGNIIKLDVLPEEYYTVPVHDKAVLTQMENSDIAGELYHAEIPTGETPDWSHTFYYTTRVSQKKCIPGNLYQDQNGNLIFANFQKTEKLVTEGNDFNNIDPEDLADRTYGPKVNGMLSSLDHLINLHEPSGDPFMTIEAIQNKITRMDGGWTDVHAPSTTEDERKLMALPINSGSTIITEAHAYKFAMANGIISMRSVPYSQLYRRNQSESFLMSHGGWNFLDVVNASNVFKYAPKLYMSSGNWVATKWGAPSSTKYQWNYDGVSIECLGNLDTYAVVSCDQIRRMLEVSMLSLLYVPGVAKFANSLS